MASLPSYRLLGVNVMAATLEEGRRRTLELAHATDGRGRYVVLPYVEFLTKAADQPELASLLNQADLCLPNGVALVWAAHYLYAGRPGLGRCFTTLASIVLAPGRLNRPLEARFDSANLTWPLLEAAAAKDLSVWLIGSPKRQSIEQTAAHLQQAIPALKISGTTKGILSEDSIKDMTERLRQAKPDLILVGLGFPLQEQLMQRLSRQLTGAVMIGEGGSFDYEAFGGRIKRAPLWLRRLGLEWAWRLIREPSRIKRVMAIPYFIWLIYRQGRRPASQP